MRKNECLAVLLCTAVLLAGCATPQPAPHVVDPLTVTDRAVRQVLAWDERQARMTPEQRQQERARLESALPAPAATMELALLLAKGSEQDRARALQLLKPLKQPVVAETAPWQPVARFLFDSLERASKEQQELNEKLEQQVQQLRESQRKNEQLNDRIGQLNQKLEALKAIELSIPQRPASPEAPVLPSPARNQP